MLRKPDLSSFLIFSLSVRSDAYLCMYVLYVCANFQVALSWYQILKKLSSPTKEDSKTCFVYSYFTQMFELRCAE